MRRSHQLDIICRELSALIQGRVNHESCVLVIGVIQYVCLCVAWVRKCSTLERKFIHALRRGYNARTLRFSERK